MKHVLCSFVDEPSSQAYKFYKWKQASFSRRASSLRESVDIHQLDAASSTSV